MDGNNLVFQFDESQGKGHCVATVTTNAEGTLKCGWLILTHDFQLRDESGQYVRRAESRTGFTWSTVAEKEKMKMKTFELQEVDLTSLTGKVLVITECTKEKLTYSSSTKVPAKIMYKGKLFEAVREFCESKRLDYAVISAKYGLLYPNEIIGGYDKVLKTRRDVEEISLWWSRG